jgi:UDP-N-acetylglucosamine transferase subunit ALG13
MSTLLVAQSGGHLAELHQLRPRLSGIDPDVVWVTFDTPQSRSLLEGEEVVFIPESHTRDFGRVLCNLAPARRLLSRSDISGVVSTGASVALSFLPLARGMGMPAHYIESATRTCGPSLTGRLLQSVPGVELYTQHERWAGGRWQWAGSVFEGYEVSERDFPRMCRAVVTLGAHPRFGFRRLVERLIEVIPSDIEVLWQTGATDVSGLPIEAHRALPATELCSAMREADLVVGHAGIGSAISALEAGRAPLLAPRDATHGEHVDDHQKQVAKDLRDLGIATVLEPEMITTEALLDMAALRAQRRKTPPRFVLGEAPQAVEALLEAPAEPALPAGVIPV